MNYTMLPEKVRVPNFLQDRRFWFLLFLVALVIFFWFRVPAPTSAEIDKVKCNA